MNQDDPGLQDALDMSRLASGHEAALSDLMGRHGLKLFHYLIRQLQDEAEAADLAQETFVRVYLHCRKFKRSASFSTWLYTIATNLARSHLRSRARRPQVSLEVESEATGASLKDTLPEQGFSPSEALQAEERAEAVRSALALLPEELRTPLILAEYEELPQSEIATVLDCSAKAVETRIYRARQQLRSILKKTLAEL
jgi:RNA polymerase sigma-70 factor (ECF subfamily)